MLTERRVAESDGVSSEEGHETWALSYIDLLLLMVTLFVLLLSFQQKQVSEPAVDKEAQSKQDASDLLLEQTFLDQSYLSDLKGKVSVVQEQNTIKLAMSDSILFLPADAALSLSGEQVLDELAVMLKHRPWHILVEGHTDNQAISTPRYLSNWELSSARASSVTRYLISKGIEPQRLSAIGYAETRPLQSNQTEPGRRKNRRVTLVLRMPD